MMILDITFTQIFTDIGIQSVGSVVLFCFLLLIITAVFMALLRVPSAFILFVTSILGTVFGSLLGNTGVIKIFISVTGLVLGVIIGFLISGLFYKD